MQYIFLIIFLGLAGCSDRPYPNLNDVPVNVMPPDTPTQVEHDVSVLLKANESAMKLLRENQQEISTSGMK